MPRSVKRSRMIRSNPDSLSWNSSRVGEGDQRQFVERGQIVALWRAQDGEVDQIDGGIALEQPAPGAFVLVGLARDQQHAQPIAHAVNLHHGAVVQRGGLAGRRVGAELEHGGAGAGDVDRHILRLADLHGLDHRRRAVPAQSEVGGAAGFGRALAQILDHHAQGEGAADDAVARRFDDANAAVPFLAFGREQSMQRGARGI